jgi:hypothetical protein
MEKPRGMGHFSADSPSAARCWPSAAIYKDRRKKRTPSKYAPGVLWRRLNSRLLLGQGRGAGEWETAGGLSSAQIEAYCVKYNVLISAVTTVGDVRPSGAPSSMVANLSSYRDAVNLISRDAGGNYLCRQSCALRLIASFCKRRYPIGKSRKPVGLGPNQVGPYRCGRNQRRSW